MVASGTETVGSCRGYPADLVGDLSDVGKCGSHVTSLKSPFFFGLGGHLLCPTFVVEHQITGHCFPRCICGFQFFFCTWSSSWVTRPFLVSCVPVGVMMPTKQGKTPKANLVGGFRGSSGLMRSRPHGCFMVPWGDGDQQK